MSRLLTILFFGLIIKPLVFIIIGLQIKDKKNLPNDSAIIIANHNSHIDTMILMSLFPLSKIHQVHPVAAADYFLKNKLMAWFSLNVLNIIPIERGRKTRFDPEATFRKCHQALDKGHILIIFPEGSRGEPEQIGQIRKGVYYLIEERKAKQHPVSTVPVALYGAGHVLPKGEALLVPFNCKIIVGKPLPELSESKDFVDTVSSFFTTALQSLRNPNQQ